MKDELPLTDRDFADVRKSVMASIEARQTRGVWMLRAMQVAFAILAVIAGAWWMTRPAHAPRTTAPSLQAPEMAQTESTNTSQLAAAPQAVPQAVQTAQQTVPQSHTPPQAHVATHASHHQRMTSIAARRHHDIPVHEIARLTEPLRLELTTDDPDIRIIWITNPTESR